MFIAVITAINEKFKRHPRRYKRFDMLGTVYIIAKVGCSRETGALNRTIERGTRAINFILSSMVFNVVPTVLEVCFFILFFPCLNDLLLQLFCLVSMLVCVFFRSVFC